MRHSDPTLPQAHRSQEVATVELPALAAAIHQASGLAVPVEARATLAHASEVARRGRAADSPAGLRAVAPPDDRV